MSEKFTLFYGGVFSQWFPSRFQINDVWYSCAEQYMMAEKARFFKDDAALVMIMQSKNPKEMKAWGRKVRGFDPVAWSGVCKEVVMAASYAKFTQNPAMKLRLLATRPTTLVEASPTDKIWGIGRSEGDPLCHDRKHWRGTNWLGEILTNLRDSFTTNEEKQ